MGSINTYNKVCSNLNTSPVEDPKLSLVSQLYFEFIFLILTLCFVLGFDRLFTLTLPLWYTNSPYFPSLLLNIPLPPPYPPVFYYIGGSFLSKWLPQTHFPLRRKTMFILFGKASISL